MKKLLSFTLALAALLTLTACAPKPEETELHIFAAASMTEVLDEFIEAYSAVDPHVTVIPTYDSSGTLLTQIQEGADCDLFLSAAQGQMDELEAEGALAEGSRTDLLENRVVLCASGFSSTKVDSFDTLAEKLKNGELLLAMDGGAFRVDDLVERTQIPVRRVLSALTLLEVDGYVSGEGGKRFQAAVKLKME